jgi:hypothetical protein
LGVDIARNLGLTKAAQITDACARIRSLHASCALEQGARVVELRN